MIDIVRYAKDQKPIWDRFVAEAKNGLFLFQRDYMDYHADRFTDASLMFFEANRLVGVMPANVREDTVFSHGGLTFGGIVTDANMKTPEMLEVFAALKEYLRRQGIRRLVYKAVPHIYHTVPAEEDLYSLFRYDARLIRRDVSSTIFMREKPALSKGRKWSIKKSKTNELTVERSDDLEQFMAIEAELLMTKYHVKPTHTAAEMRLLATAFPENIKLFAVNKNGTMLGGSIIYESANVAHTQYITSTDEGKRLFATDFLLNCLINDTYAEKKYFDFGISTEQDGRFLNIGLVTQKEEFGARAVSYDTYEMDV